MAVQLQGNLVKKAHKKIKYTDKMMADLQKCSDPVTGPMYFMENFLQIQHPTKGSIQFEPFEFQKKLVKNYHENRFSINMLPRQTGKTTCASAYLLWYAMFVPDSQILIAAHKYTGAQDIMNRFRYAYESVPDFIRPGIYSYNRNTIEFDNGSRVKATTTTENTGRGMSLSVIYCDEFAFVNPPNKAKEFWTALSPTLATGGKCIITSTPNSDEDQFALLWKEANKNLDENGEVMKTGVNGFASYKAHWSEHPDRDEEWARDEKSRIGIERFRREHECEFIIYDETLINAIKLVDLAPKEPYERHGQVRWYKKPRAGHAYMASLDPSLGTGGDYAAIQVFELPGMIQCAEWQHNNTPIQGQIRVLKDIVNSIDKTVTTHSQKSSEIYYSVENNTIGEAALMAIQDHGEENIKGLFVSEPIKRGHVRRFRKGFNTTHKAKISACAKLKEYIENDKMTLSSKNLISELKTFVAAGQSFSAKPGEHDDLVSATLLICRMVNVIAGWDQKLYTRLKDNIEDEIQPMPIFVVT
jgi:hypothetical protein